MDGPTHTQVEAGQAQAEAWEAVFDIARGGNLDQIQGGGEHEPSTKGADAAEAGGEHKANGAVAPGESLSRGHAARGARGTKMENALEQLLGSSRRGDECNGRGEGRLSIEESKH
ncbi:unnamed protein product [Calypogeia fissa]